MALYGRQGPKPWAKRPGGLGAVRRREDLTTTYDRNPPDASRTLSPRICSGCGKQYDLSEPRLWVCGACGEARYCDEACQREHWPAHKRECLHAWTEKVEQRLSQGVSREEVQQELDDGYQNG